MKIFEKIDYQNLLLDAVITLLAFQFLNLTEFVSETLRWMIYLIVLIQSFAFFLLYSDFGFLEWKDQYNKNKVLEKLKCRFELILRGYIMFSWIFSFLWILVPVEYLKSEKGLDYTGAAAISFFINLFVGLLIFIRLFANDDYGEKQTIKKFWKRPFKNRSWGEIFIIPVYEFLLYGHLFNKKVRYWIAYFITFGFLVYTETLFEIIAQSGEIITPFWIFAIMFSYFPVRMLLLIRPPFSTIEMFSAFTAFGIFIYTLIT